MFSGFSKHKRTLLIFSILLGAILKDTLTYGQINVEPNTALLNEGDPTELLCRYGRLINYCRFEIPGEKVLNLSPEWIKSDNFRYYGSGLAAGQCGVSIKNVRAVNNGQVKCSLGVEGEELSGTIDLVVALRPKQPIIEILEKSDRGFFTEGTLFVARCTVRDGRPAANISWLLDDLPAQGRTSQLNVVASNDNRNISLFNTEQEIQWHLGPEDNGRKLVCRSHHQTDRENVPPQQGIVQIFVKFAPVKQPESSVYGLYLEQTAIINMTVRANPAPVVQWTVDGHVIQQGEQWQRYSVYEPQYLGQDYYNVTMAIAGLTLEDTTKIYELTATNALGSADYQVRISSSNTPPTAGLDIGAIVGIVVAVAVLIIIVLLIVFARATGKWCFAEESPNPPANETSDTESADVRAVSVATTATTAAASESPASDATNKKSKRQLPTFASIFKRMNEKDAAKRKVPEPSADGNADVATTAATSAAPQATEGTDGNDNEPKEDKQLVYAELVLKPAEHNEPLPPKNATEYAEIVYIQKSNTEQ